MLLNEEHRSSASNGSGFGAWYRARPFVGGILIVLAGIEIFLSSQLDPGNLHIQLGIEGFQATVIPIGLVLLGALAIFMPAHHVFYGVIALAVAVYSMVGVNLGGFVLGMLLGCVGGVMVVAWMPRAARVQAEASDEGAGEGAEPVEAEDAGPGDEQPTASITELLAAADETDTDEAPDAQPRPQSRRRRDTAA
jgi:hypothetical protein